MKALEFEAKVGPDQTLTIPQEAAEEVAPGMILRVLLLIPEKSKDQWSQVASEQFLEGYSDSDCIYDNL